MAYIIRPADGLHFDANNYHCAIGFVETGIGFQELIVGVGPVGSMEFDAPEIIWTGDVNSIQHMGSFIVSQLPAINAALNRQLHPLFVPVDNNAPATMEGLNTALREYFKETTQADGSLSVTLQYP